jgi:hypothetical protein
MTAPQPMTVLADVTVQWGRHANGVPMTRFVRHGAIVGIVPGSPLAAAYGGSSNLASLTAPQLSDGADADESEVSN